MKMVKKIVGYIFALVVIAVIVYTVLGAGTYKSMLPEDLFSSIGTMEEESQVEASVAEPDSLVTKPDSLEVMVISTEVADTTAVENW